MMLIREVATAILMASFLLAACQPASSTQSPVSTLPASTKAPASITEPQEITESPTEAKVIIPEPSQELTLPVPSETAAENNPNELNKDVWIPVDGLELAGTFYYPQNHAPPWPGVILIHMLYGDRTQWNSFPQELIEAGIAVLSIDLRGHGETGGEVDWDLAVSDLQQVWNYFTGQQDIDLDRTAYIGASIGANLALIASSNESSVRTAVLLSPGLSYAGVETEEAMLTFGDRPVLIIASQDDVYAANSSSTLHTNAIGESQLIMYQNAGHGTLMFQSEPELSQAITEWLTLYLE
jgi:alpha-beta hydrolase superfamily lysophospholipase